MKMQDQLSTIKLITCTWNFPEHYTHTHTHTHTHDLPLTLITIVQYSFTISALHIWKQAERK